MYNILNNNADIIDVRELKLASKIPEIDGIEKAYECPYKPGFCIIISQNTRGLNTKEIDIISRMPGYRGILKPSQIQYVINEEGKKDIGFTIRNSYKKYISNISSFNALNEIKIKDFLIQIIPSLSYLHSNKLTHKEIRLNNLLYDSSEECFSDNTIPMLGDWFLNQPGFYQTYEYQTIQTPHYHLALRARHQPHHDIYALGILIVQLLLGSNIFIDKAPETIVAKKNKEGSYNAVAKYINGLCSSKLLLLLHKLLEDHESRRWQCSDIVKWMYSYDNKFEIIYSSTKINSTSSNFQDKNEIREMKIDLDYNICNQIFKIDIFHSLYPYYFKNDSYSSCYSLGIAFAYNWKEAILIVGSQEKISMLLQWIRLAANNHNAANKIMKVINNQNNSFNYNSLDIILSFIILNLTSSHVFVYKGVFLYYDTFARMIYILSDKSNSIKGIIYDESFEIDENHYKENSEYDADIITKKFVERIVIEFIETPIMEMLMSYYPYNDASIRSKLTIFRYYYHNSSMLTSGLDRCFYTFDAHKYCISPLISDSYITSTGELLEIIEKKSGELSCKEVEDLITDNNILSFAIELSPQRNIHKIIVNHISYNDSKDLIILGALLILESSRDIKNPIKFHNLSEKIYPRLKEIIKNMSKRSLKEYLLREATISSMQNDFSTLIYLYMIAMGKKIPYDFLRAINEYANLEKKMHSLMIREGCDSYAHKNSSYTIYKALGIAFFVPLWGIIKD